MKILVKLYNMEDPAADGSIIPRQQTSNYLASEEYKRMTDEHLALCGITHKDRVLGPDLKNVVGPDDQVLINENYIGYIDQIFIRDSTDKYCYAYIQVFDPDQFSGKAKDQITNFIGFMKAGTKLPCSVVIQAMWSPSNRAERIIRIKGMDFTLNPSFKGSGTVKVMSHKEENKKWRQGMFSGGDCECETRSFATEMTVVKQVNGIPVSASRTVSPSPSGTSSKTTVVSDSSASSDPFGGKRTFTREEVISKYGRASKVAEATSGMDKVPVKFISSILDGSMDASLAPAVELVRGDMADQTDERRDTLLSLMRRHYDDVMDIMKDAPESEETKAKLMRYLSGLPCKERLFSTVRSIEDRMLYSHLHRPILFRRMLDNYRKFYTSKMSKLTEEDKKYLKEMIKGDVRIVLNGCRQKVAAGEPLSPMLQLAHFGNNMHEAGNELSRVLRRVILTENIMGFIPANITFRWQSAVRNFYNEIFAYCLNDEDAASGLSTLDKLQ